MYLWKYGAESVTAAQRLANRPVLMLKTRRSLRAVHFHPQGAPLILTAEVSQQICLDEYIYQVIITPIFISVDSLLQYTALCVTIH
jgi:hypothetical protein